MNVRLLSTHLAVAIIAFGLGYAVFSSGSSGADKLQRLDDPVAALTDALKIEDAHARTQALLDFFAAADPAWAERLRAEVNQPDSEVILDEIGETLFAEWWAKSDPEAAFKNLVDPAWANRHPWIRAVMKAWVASDPSRAAEATASLPPNPDRGQVEATSILVQHWWDNEANSDPGPLLALIHKLPVTPRASAIHVLIRNSIEKRGIDATEQFVESTPQADALGVDVPQEMLGRYAQALLDVDLERAKKWAEKHGQGRDGAGILRHLAFSWGVKDGAAAMDWAIHLPDSTQRAGIIMRVWLSYREAHPDESRNWLLAQEPTEIVEHVYRRYLNGTAGDDVEKAFEIAGRAKDPALRDRLRTAVAIGWGQKDAEAVTKWLETVELVPELKEQVRRSMPSTPPMPPVQSTPAAAG